VERGRKMTPNEHTGRESRGVEREKSGERERERTIYNTVYRKGSFRRACENDTM
jgi:hypothetical protein